MALNKVLLIGNVGKDPEVRHLESGVSVATITLATTERYKDRGGETKELTEWHTINAWRNLADLAENYIRKGSQIYVEGRIRTRSWDDQNGQKRYVTEILADNIQLLGRREGSGAQNPAPSQPQRAYQASPAPQHAQYSAPAQQSSQYSAPVVNQNDFADDGTDDLPF
ncbi:MAG: single-stranded DNA-binding protein [Bacteroidales bacterium]|nr:single-stranded DNA-binding protein [Candidatus Cacconaster merdequi]